MADGRLLVRRTRAAATPVTVWRSRLALTLAVVLVVVAAAVAGQAGVKAEEVGDPGPPENLLSEVQSGFESTPLGWFGQYGTVDHSAVAGHSGMASLRVRGTQRPLGESAVSVGTAEPLEVAAGPVYSGSAWVSSMHGTSRSVSIGLVFIGADDVVGVAWTIR